MTSPTSASTSAPTPGSTPAGSGGVPGIESARSRRLRSAAMAVLGVVAVVVCLVFANILATRYSARVDVTATGEHHLAPRTESMLAKLDGQYRVVLAGELSAVDRGQLERVRDVLVQMQRISGKIDLRMLDTASPSGQQDFQALIADLAARDKAVLDLQVNTIRAAADRALATAEYLDSGLAPAISQVRDTLAVDSANLKLRETLDSRAAGCRLSAKDLRAAAAAIEEPLGSKISGTAIPQTDVAGRALRGPLASVGEQVGTLARELAAIGGAASLPPATRDAAKGIIDAVEKARDTAITAADTVGRLARPDVLRVTGALSDGNACIVVGPPGAGLMAIEFGQLFPAQMRAAESAADAGRRAEQLVSTAIGALATPIRPIVVIMHAEVGSGVVTQKGIVTRAIERLALRGIDVAEWPVVLQAEPPALTALNPKGDRPVIFATIPPDSSAGRPRPTDATGAERAAKFGAAIEKIADRGYPILLSIYPSVLPSYGDADPTVGVLTRFGLAADTARPIMRGRMTPQGSTVDTEQSLRAAGGEHPIQKAIRGLPTLFLWPVQLRPAAVQPTTAPAVTPLFEVPSQTESWAESQWLNYWRAPRADRNVALNPPQFDEGRDGRDYPMVVAYAAELPPAAGQARRRLLAIGTNRWFMDPITTPMMNVDGRTFPANPGNLELFEAGIYWLAGQDELIAQSPEARAVAIIGPLSESALRTIRLALILGVPAVVLIAGVIYRVAKG